MRARGIAAGLTGRLILLSTLLGMSAHALDNGLARTPPMGWNSWNKYACNINETLIKQQADAMVSSGLKAAGYQYINIDDCWQVSRDANGNIVADSTRFPSGIAALADYVHSKGLKLGVYTDIGTATCQGRPGSRGYEVKDANQYAAWGVDYVKVDWCNTPGYDAPSSYAVMRDALAQASRPIVFSICNWGVQSPWNWGPSTGNLWRTTGDINDSWGSFTGILDSNAQHAASAGPGSWNDPDMLIVGLYGSNGVGGTGMTDTEYQAHFSLWALMAAPLIMGNDLTNMNAATRNILMNSEVIAVDQDPLGIQGSKVVDNNGLQVWSKKLTGSGVRAVVLFNRSAAAANITANWSDLGLAAGSATVRDLWAKADRGSFTNSYTANVPSHGVVMLKVVGTEVVVPVGTTYLSDDTWSLASSGWGPVERNLSNGEQASGDGRTITLNGATYAKGLGIHANSQVDFNLSGRCSSFTADIGLDDEVGSNGSVIFQVWGDSTKLYDSGTMTGASATKSLSVNVSGRSTLKLVVTDNGDNDQYDHADWANARITCGSTATFEAEDSANTLAGGAVRATCPGCSGGQKVGFLGNGGTLTFNSVYVPVAGNYTLTVSYSTAEVRSLSLRVNAGTTATYSLASTGSYDVPASWQTTVNLSAGNNTLQFSNASGWAPDLDKISVQ
ncbi:NPCBM/NEW2 domain-containing protein [Hyalangium versicolor]|uniref:NPCBM/NEW2 domain-containing protein n=1 Tax=Hyalangium versicolor TaxID=2861190 RepID=UPI001CCA3A89|nr:NPCBM/NEW2 domain-containing protein [Hyalangium versicolor]